MKWENTPDLPPGWKDREERRCLGVGEELILNHQNIQQCLTSDIIHKITLQPLEEEVKWEKTPALPPGWMGREKGTSLVLG